MKILVLNGSPKREHSDTMHITRAFLEGMKEAAPQDVRIIHTNDQHIEYCTGCFSCMQNGGSCIHNDDMKAILVEILDSDADVHLYRRDCFWHHGRLAHFICFLSSLYGRITETGFFEMQITGKSNRLDAGGGGSCWITD